MMKLVLILTMTTVGFSACITPPKKNKPVKPIIEKQEDAPTSATNPPQNTAPKKLKPPSGKQLWQFVKQQSLANAPFGDEERAFVERIRNKPAQSSISEAALTIGVIGLVLHPLHQTVSTFEESDLNDAPAPNPEENSNFSSPGAYTGTGPSLEAISNQYGVNIPDAITENPLLGSAFISKSALEALRVGPNSPDFMNDVIFAVRTRANSWLTVSSYLGDTDATTATDMPETPLFDPNVAPNPADLRSGDSLLVDAQKLADKGNYQAALKRIVLIPQSSPLFSVAQEKTKEFSNRAVQDLRRKAARAFRSAMPGADLETRAQYLREAKAFLERAIKDYPSAPQLPTVRENLRVISQDLERLENSRG